MYRKNKTEKTTISCNESYQGETIEQKMRRVMNNKEPITDGAPITYTERKDGVRPEFDIRTDRFEIAQAAMDKVTQAHIAKRDNKPDMKVVEGGQKPNTDKPKEGEA